MEDEKKREELKELLTRLKPRSMGVIVRTLAEQATEEEIETELKFLVRLWQKVQEKADFVTAPRLGPCGRNAFVPHGARYVYAGCG